MGIPIVFDDMQVVATCCDQQTSDGSETGAGSTMQLALPHELLAVLRNDRDAANHHVRMHQKQSPKMASYAPVLCDSIPISDGLILSLYI